MTVPHLLSLNLIIVCLYVCHASFQSVPLCDRFQFYTAGGGGLLCNCCAMHTQISNVGLLSQAAPLRLKRQLQAEWLWIQ